MTQYVVRDPKRIDGEPHEVADEVGENLVELLDAALQAAVNFEWAARGAWMTAEHHLTGHMPEGEAFAHSSVGGKINELKETLTDQRHSATVLRKAAAWNPRST